MLELLNKILERAKENLERDRIIAPMVIFSKDGLDDLIVIPMLFKSEFTSEENKTQNAIAAGAFAGGVGAEIVILVWDAAYRTISADTVYDETELPLTYPKNMRTECLLIEGIDIQSGTEQILIAPYKGGDGEPVEFLPDTFPKNNEMESRFKELVLKGYILGKELSK